MSLITSASVNDERDHAAITTNNEFAALAIKVQSDAALDELMRLPHFLSLSRRQASDLDVIEDFLTEWAAMGVPNGLLLRLFRNTRVFQDSRVH